MQLDQDEKGFSFLREGPLDMRMDPSQPLTAEEVVNKWSESKLGEIFYAGEEPRWKRAAKAIVEARRKKAIRTTTQLAEIVSDAFGSGRGRLHPATLVFQALRIFVNDELNVLQQGLTRAAELLNVGGRIGVISFHSLEDRIVKNIFRSGAAQETQVKRGAHLLKVLTKKPVVPSLREIRKNPRSRSAKMRFAEKIAQKMEM